MEQKKVLFIFGTRPEAIKLAPVIKMFARHKSWFRTIVVVTAQHRQMLDQVIKLFRLRTDYDLDIMTHDQTLAQITARAIEGLDKVLLGERPDIVFVQGDTTTTFVGALTAFYHRIPVAHVEAGLRTYDRYHPYPEEMNRMMTSALVNLHFAPTERSRLNLLKENVSPSKIHVTGNTVIDSLLDVSGRRYLFDSTLKNIFKNTRTRKILLTTHRRESHGKPLKEICEAVLELVDRYDDIEFLFPVHMSVNVRKIVYPALAGKSRIHLIEPLDYQTFVNVMKRSYLIITDSGGIQEEAPSLGKPVLVLRQTTERPEAVEAGTVRLVGTNYDLILRETERLLSDRAAYETMSRAINPYGDGLASERIVKTVINYFNLEQ